MMLPVQCFLLLAIATTAAAQTDDMVPFGTGRSQGKVNATEQTMFTYSSSTFGVMTHFWVAGSPVVDRTTIRYYVDGETLPSVEFIPSEACGVGFDNQVAPWGTKWFGKGAKSTGWFHNFRIPFKSIRITYQLETGEPEGTIWMIVRGLENYKFTIGDISIPPTARMKLIQHKNVTLQPLEFIDLVNVQSKGMLFLTMMQVRSTNFAFMEGCFHFYNNKQYVDWPGMLLSTGMEDYYDSAFYFNGGTFHLPVSGSTFMNSSKGQWSGYRFHEMDPIVYSNGMRLQWRNGDVTDEATGLKCTLQTGGKVNGNKLGVSQLTSLMWVYQFD